MREPNSEADSQVKSKAIRGDGRAKEQMQVFIESDPDSRLPASDKENIPDIAIDYFPLFSGFKV